MIDVTTRGLIADNVTDNSPALNALIASLPASGGVLFFPAGNYRFHSTVPINKSSISLIGEGAYAATVLWYDGTGNFLDVLSVQYTKMSDLTLRSSTVGWTGYLVTVRDGGGNSPSGTSFINVNFSPSASSFGLSVNNSLSNYLENCRFSGGHGGLVGRSLPSDYSNGLQMRGGQFVGQIGSPIYCGGEAWSFEGVTFEARADGRGVAFVGDITVPSYALKFDSCWFGDVTLGGQTWIQHWGYGLVFTGNHVTGIQSGQYGLGLNRTKGFHIAGNDFAAMSSCVDYTTGICQGGVVSGNAYNRTTAFETSTGNKDSSVSVVSNIAY
jgi:hypothetical protein